MDIETMKPAEISISPMTMGTQKSSTRRPRTGSSSCSAESMAAGVCPVSKEQTIDANPP